VPMVAPALEVSFVDDSGPGLVPATSPETGRPLRNAQAGSLAQLDAFARVFDALYEGAEAMGLQLDEAQSGAGLGQFRLTMAPKPAMRAADDLWLLKALVRGTARRHDIAACFLAKPFTDQPGNGLHLSFWPENRERQNLFDNGMISGNKMMQQAIAGCVSCQPGATLIFAPFEPSFRRYAPDSHAPTSASWGFENRTAAIRIPAGDPAARRIQHRAPGADANPYLAVAAALGSALVGIEDMLVAPEPVIGNAYSQRVLQFPMDWDSAIERFATSPRMARLFPVELIRAMTAVKRQEQRRFAPLSAPELMSALIDAA